MVEVTAFILLSVIATTLYAIMRILGCIADSLWVIERIAKKEHDSNR